MKRSLPVVVAALLERLVVSGGFIVQAHIEHLIQQVKNYDPNINL
jgi:hypothetical protein